MFARSYVTIRLNYREDVTPDDYEPKHFRRSTEEEGDDLICYVAYWRLQTASCSLLSLSASALATSRRPITS